MSVRRLAAAAALCVVASPAVFAQGNQGAQTAPAAERRVPVAGPAPAFPRTLADAKAAEAVQSQRPEWPRQDIELAQARCDHLLKGLDVVAVPEVPIREGAECGTPAPVRLLSIGKNPQIALSPPPIVTCDMIAALHKWLEGHVQPLARKHLGAPIVRIEAMSSYSCRNAYGRAKSRLSEHGRANALDIGSFVTARGKAAMVIADWGPTARDIEAQVAAARQQPEKAGSTPAAAPAAAPARHPQPATGAPQPPAPPAVRAGTIIAIPGITVQVPGLPGGHAPELGFAGPSRLGGPKPPAEAPPPAALAEADGKTLFLRAAHRAACRVFGTVLGPEANRAHENHFHVDMADRKGAAICE